MKITGISITSNSLPLDGSDYAVARITSIEGDMLSSLKSFIYPEGKNRATNVISGSPLENYGAIYTFVKNVHLSEDNQVSAELITSLDDLLSPFEFNPQLKSECIDYFFTQRAGQLNLKMEIFPLEDEGNITDGFLFYSLDEAAYIQSDAMRVEELLNPNKAAELRADKSIEMLFADMMKKCVDIYNGENYHKKAAVIANLISKARQNNLGRTNITLGQVDDLLGSLKHHICVLNPDIEQTRPLDVDMSIENGWLLDAESGRAIATISNIIKNIRYFDVMGNKGPLNMTAVDNLISNIKDNIKIC